MITTDVFETISYSDADRIAILENKAAELERRLLAATGPQDMTGWVNVATPDDAGAGSLLRGQPPDYDAFAGEPAALDADASGDGGGLDADDDGAVAAERTEALIKRGRPRATRARGHRNTARWRLIAAGAAALLLGVIAALLASGGGGASWPASVAAVKAQIKQACANPDVAAEPSGLDFACAKGTQPVLWVFALLTSGGGPGYVDQATGRKGLEPIQPAQGGDIAWSLNLHHPYNPANPVDSLSVAARAINNIIYGATVTSPSGAPAVQAGLESSAANCQRYTGSSALVTRSGYPARCAAPVSTGAGGAALVSDVFQRWMGGTPRQLASEAGVLFKNADNPGNPQVQAILASLPASGS